MGNKATYIENGISDVIWVKCDTDQATVEMSNFEAEENDSAVYIGNGVGFIRGKQYNVWPKIKREFTPIAPQDVKKFTFLDNNKSTIYLTIVAANGEVIENAIPKAKGIYFVVKENETSEEAKLFHNYNQQPMPPVSEPSWIPKKREVSQWVSEGPGGGYWVRWIWTPEQKWRRYSQFKR